ncbi:MAG TPA: DUF664 domain-containing protein [Acidimicrobiia bacterium]|nr:DUF664 domain-containing protein [Acidimicrobiia bacterium]
MVSDDDYLYFVDRALDGMAAILAAMGDDLANRRPDLPGANSPYAIVTHCLGVVEYWAGHLVAGREVHRDRPAEFTATGPVDHLIARVDLAKGQLRHDLSAAETLAPLRHEPPGDHLVTTPGLTQGGALLHVYEELSQHLGQLEITRDVLIRPTTAPPTT